MKVGVFTPLLSQLPIEDVFQKLKSYNIDTVELGTGNLIEGFEDGLRIGLGQTGSLGDLAEELTLSERHEAPSFAITRGIETHAPDSVPQFP